MARQPKIYTVRPAPFVSSALIAEKLGLRTNQQCTVYVVATTKVGAHVLLTAAGIHGGARDIREAMGNHLDALLDLLTEPDTILVSTVHEQIGDSVVRVTSPTEVEEIGYWDIQRNPRWSGAVDPHAWLPTLVRVSSCE